MKEIEILIQRAERAIMSAELLLHKNTFKASVSCSYYIIFYAVEALLLTKRLRFFSHRSFILLFGEYFIKIGIFKLEIGKRLSKTFENGLIGDYNFASHMDDVTAKEVLGRLKEFISEIRHSLVKEGDVR